MYLKILFLLTIMGLTACSSFQRTNESGYGDLEANQKQDNFFDEREYYQQEKIREELGLSPSRALSDNDRRAINTRIELKRLESSIPNRAEKQHYYKFKPFLKNDLHKIYFLNLPSIEARERWASRNGVSANPEKYSQRYNKYVENNDIVTGMPKQTVRESWGDPDIIEYAGNPLFGNERWKYTKMVSSVEGYNQEVRIIYFESGRVVGWEKTTN